MGGIDTVNTTTHSHHIRDTTFHVSQSGSHCATRYNLLVITSHSDSSFLSYLHETLINFL